jgi:hypothetical protein
MLDDPWSVNKMRASQVAMNAPMTIAGLIKAGLSGGGFDPNLGASSGLTHSGGASFRLGKRGTGSIIADLPEKSPGGDQEAWGNLILSNPGQNPKVQDFLEQHHEPGHIAQGGIAGPLLRPIAGLAQAATGYEGNPIEKSAGPMSQWQKMLWGPR